MLIDDEIVSNLQSGPYGLVALFAIIWPVLMSFTLFKKFYGFSVGYGYSVFACGLVLWNVFTTGSAPNTLYSADAGITFTTGRWLVRACLIYGARLGSYLLLRDITRKWNPMENGSIGSRIVLSISLALFYAMLMTPVLYCLRKEAASTTDSAEDIDDNGGDVQMQLPRLIQIFGCVLSWFGAILEAVADMQKFLVKQRQASLIVEGGNESKDKKVEKFVGPTNGAYRISRHPNYLGEVLFWAGQVVAASPTFSGIQPWLWSGLGFLGIFSVMTMAAARLEKKQQEKYGGQKDYDKWRNEVKGSLFFHP
mmetsp:Transcript_20042/g.32374  ORF Transcript_20042/g.32374 Transcript_20042/m.32374 type:complete len:309 (+) Transcript_20042:255-1181(+)|eukprot:CAMPEP_0178753296 /NCGR_PEP_ID=MMETSP0744-20121128/11535_1 /TAXON_ID=913974 /ORGANISM="Nitzschia punctata, Strain CCMP561" /LENGTH=308 /DNA_ID=CAMNT_0020407101 /DNA_START=157 /DNA_END=1083 /DNA_ORIENTATION=+